MSEPPQGERIQIGDQYYLIASARGSRRRRWTLSHGDLFGIFDLSGDVPAAGLEDLGLFFHGTRHLDRLELYDNRQTPHFLESHVTDDNIEFVSDLTNADIVESDRVLVPRDTIAVRRVKALARDGLLERIELHNYWIASLRCELLMRVHADFADIFELRGITRAERGSVMAPQVRHDGVTFAYGGRDHRQRRTVIATNPAPASSSAEGFVHVLDLAPGEIWTLDLSVRCELDGIEPGPSRSFVEVRAERRDGERAWRQSHARISSSNAMFDDWLARSVADVAMLRSTDDGSPYLYAGIPWFATLFGRDSIIAALETLTFAPHIAAGTLRRLAGLQGTAENAERDEQPGKIVHEVRDDEMAVSGEVPFGRYYGSVDSTPLFCMLAAAYVRRTGDVELAEMLWPHLERALEWIAHYGDRDGDGFVEYARETPRGLANQGWKDSHDSIFHADGRIAPPPIALVEVQGYVYAAWRGLAAVARRLGKTTRARELRRQALELRSRFHRAFWMEKDGFFALALDAEKRRCEVITSNPGHCLYAGIVDAGVAPRVVERLMRDDLFCGWGVRTLAAGEPRYNPLSYHNGSVWPHDNALLAAGLRRYGAIAECVRVATALFETAQRMEDRRLPELFCGFDRRDRATPVPYPVACRPQAWASGSVFLLLQSLLGVSFSPRRSSIVFDRPRLPAWVQSVTIRDLTLGDAVVDLQVNGPAVEVVRRTGDVEVLVRS